MYIVLINMYIYNTVSLLRCDIALVPWLADGVEATGIPFQKTRGHDGGRVCRDNGRFGSPHS